MTPAKVLLVDDEPHILSALQRCLRREAYQVTATSSPEEALQLLATERYAVLVTDQRMPTMNGTRLLELAKKTCPETRRLILTGYAEFQATVDAINRGAAARFLTKPWNDEELRHAISEAVSQHELGNEIRNLQELTGRQNEELKKLNSQLVLDRAQESAVAAGIQSALLTCNPPVDLQGAQIAALSVSSEQVDGDFVEFLRHSSTCLDIVVGDVMGKGIPAALLGGAVKYQIARALSFLMSRSGDGRLPEPAQIVNHVHGELSARLLQLGSFVTLMYARLDLERNTLTFVDCGHTKSLLLRDGGRSQFLEGENVPLGFCEAEVYRQVTLPLAPNDLLLVYSDGLTEARNRQGELYGPQRLRRLLHQNVDATPSELIDRIQRSAADFTGSEIFADDVTAVALKRSASQGSADALRSTFDICADVNELQTLRQFVGAFCQATQNGAVAEAEVESFTLAVHEIAVNIIEHAYGGTSGNRIRVEAIHSDGSVTLRLGHRGTPFDPRCRTAPALDGTHERGYGLFIAERSADGVIYASQESGMHSITLTRKLKGTCHADHG